MDPEIKKFKCDACKKEITRNSPAQKYCRECFLEHRKFYNKNYFSNYYLQNKEILQKMNNKYKEIHKEELEQKNKIWIENNRDKLYEQTRRYRKKYPERNRAYTRVERKGLKDTQCSRCSSIDNLEFHHTNYELDEGITVCKNCHNKIHEWLKCPKLKI